MDKFTQVCDLIWQLGQIVVPQIQDLQPVGIFRSGDGTTGKKSHLGRENKEGGRVDSWLSPRSSSSREAAFLRREGGTLVREWRLRSCCVEGAFRQGSKAEADGIAAWHQIF